MALTYYALKNTRIGGHVYAIGDKVADADLNNKGSLLVSRGLVTADGSSGGGGGGGGLVHIATQAFVEDMVTIDGVAPGGVFTAMRGKFSAAYDNYRLVLNGDEQDGSSQDLYCYMETAEGVLSLAEYSYWAAAYSRNFFTETNPDTLQQNSGTGAGWLANWKVGRIAPSFSLVMDIFAPLLSRQTTAMWKGFGAETVVGGDYDSMRMFDGGGGIRCTDVHTGILIGGAISGGLWGAALPIGSASLYGYAKA